MCDFSLESVKSRAAVKGDKLITHNFGLTRGFGDPNPELTCPVAVCVRPGTEIAFDAPVRAALTMNINNPDAVLPNVAKFVQINQEQKHAHHDALEFVDGQIVLLHHLREGQHAHVLQVPPEPVKAETETNEAPAPKKEMRTSDWCVVV
jgi:hypothetical protein